MNLNKAIINYMSSKSLFQTSKEGERKDYAKAELKKAENDLYKLYDNDGLSAVEKLRVEEVLNSTIILN
jgi:hypothetical protein